MLSARHLSHPKGGDKCLRNIDGVAIERGDQLLRKCDEHGNITRPSCVEGLLAYLRMYCGLAMETKVTCLPNEEGFIPILQIT